MRRSHQDGAERPNGEVCEITAGLDLRRWPTGSRVIVRRERPHPGAQLCSPTTTATASKPPSPTSPTPTSPSSNAATAPAPASRTSIRNDKDTGLRNLPFRDFEHNRVWLQLVLLAHDLIVWTQWLLLDGELARGEPKRLRYRLLHTAGRLAFHARTATLRLQASWPWAGELAAAFARLKALPAPAG